MIKCPHKCAVHDQFGVNESFISIQSLLFLLPELWFRIARINVQMIP